MRTWPAQFRLMLSGTLETVNDWSFNRFGDMLVEMHDGYHVNQTVASELIQEA